MVIRSRKPREPVATAATHARPQSRILIIEARYYEEIADLLVEGAIAEIEAHGDCYERVVVPGALEIPHVLGQAVADGLIPASAPSARYAGAVALGCVIRGETSHYDIVCNNANHWLYETAIRHTIPIGNGILTVDTEKQAIERAKGGRDGKGGDAARACLRLIEIAREFEGHVS